MWDSPYFNSPFSSLSSDISLEISVYSTTLGLPFLLQNTPTLSSGHAFTTLFPPANTFFSIHNPTKIGSTIFAKTLSTPPIKAHWIPLAFIS